MTSSGVPNESEYDALMGGLIVAAGEVHLASDAEEQNAHVAYVDTVAEKLLALKDVGTVTTLAVYAAGLLIRLARNEHRDPRVVLEGFELRLLVDDDDDASS